MLHEDFTGDELHPRLQRYLAGVGVLERTPEHTLRMVLAGARANAYSDAQLDDYHGLKARDFPWRPPLRMTVRARASHPAHELRGTAGFGFWNEPFLPGRTLPRLPRNAWFFFGSPPSDMALAMGVPGSGWKAATLDTMRPAFWLLAPTAPLSVLLMRVPALYRLLWPLGQRAIGASEALLPVALDEWHTYELEWRADGVTFMVDGALIHTSPHSPRGPLGFVAWLDNQYAVATPQGRIKFGLLDCPARQWLELDSVAIESLA